MVVSSSGMLAYVGRPQRPCLGDEHAEDAATLAGAHRSRGGSPRRTPAVEGPKLFAPFVEDA
jgi:hypothetical protein